MQGLKNKKTALVLLVSEVVFIILFSVFIEYDHSADAGYRPNSMDFQHAHHHGDGDDDDHMHYGPNKPEPEHDHHSDDDDDDDVKHVFRRAADNTTDPPPVDDITQPAPTPAKGITNVNATKPAVPDVEESTQPTPAKPSKAPVTEHPAADGDKDKPHLPPRGLKPGDLHHHNQVKDFYPSKSKTGPNILDNSLRRVPISLTVVQFRYQPL